MLTTTPDVCGETTWRLHAKAFLLVATLPCGTTANILLAKGMEVGAVCRWVLLVGALVATPRLVSVALLPSGGGGGGCVQLLHTGLLAFYWNLVMLVCFFSPLLIGAGIWAAPLPIAGPLGAAWLVWSRVLSRPDLHPELGDASAAPRRWRRWEWATPWRAFSQREWGYDVFRRYLSLRLHVDRELAARDPHSPVIIAVHPHGVASDYRILVDGMLYDALPKRPVYCLAASVLFMLPLIRELSLWTRCVDASRAVASRVLRGGASLMVIPGGEKEQLDTRRGVEQVFLRSRRGFVRLALSHASASGGNAPAGLVPAYAFGVVDLYETYGALRSPREWLRKTLGVCVPLYAGVAGVLPRRVPLNLVLGKPLQLPPPATAGAPTDAEVDAAHAVYVAALRRLFDEHKGRFGYADRELVVV